MKYIFYEDIPKEERKELRKQTVKNNWSIRIWNGFSGALAIFIGYTIANGCYTESSEKLIMGVLLTAGLAVAFYTSIVEPKIIRSIEREKNS